MSPEDAAQALIRRWVSWYVRGLPGQVARRRYDELTADLHDQISHELEAGQARWLVAAHLILRTLKGIPADLSWRAHVRGHSQPASPGRQIGARVRTTIRRVSAIIATTAVVLATSWVFVSVLMGRTRSWPGSWMHSDTAVAAWVVFGAALGAAVRWLPRQVAGGTAVLLAAVGLADLLAAPFGPTVAWIARSEYLWIAMAALAVKASTPEMAPVTTSRNGPTTGSADAPSTNTGRWESAVATLGDRVRHARHQREYSLRELAAELGCSPVTLSQIERDLHPPDPNLWGRLNRWLDGGSPPGGGAVPVR